MVLLVGQRVIAQNEPELGLGLIISVQGRHRLEVLYSGVGVVRQYASTTAPLQRFVLRPGQRAVSKAGESFVVHKVEVTDGVCQYQGEKGQLLWEYELHHQIEDLGALNQFLIGRFSPWRTYDLRKKGWLLRADSLAPEIRGLVGARVGLLPHQMYVAYSVAHREAPRVLLADEVGLGKTVEAGLIFSSLKALGRANRVLVLAPEHLKFQWLAELYRRFNELFSVLDEERTEEEEKSQEGSVFENSQKVICSIDFLLESPDRLREAAESGWDLLIIDEAHYLEWHPDEASEKWEAARVLVECSKSALLLTATPRQRGLETQFGLLHLVDPQRFSNFDNFVDEMTNLKRTAKVAQQLSENPKDRSARSKLKELFSEDSGLLQLLEATDKSGEADPILKALVDRHGTGRVFIRNRREKLRGFPRRILKSFRLDPDAAYKKKIKEFDPTAAEPEEAWMLACGRWTSKETLGPRGPWLLDAIQKLGKEKALIICASPRKAAAIDEFLRESSGIKRATFHEKMELVERDRQAAWFAQPDGAQVLISSEIGGEGRNFQFASKLFLMDMPPHPDLLEQRIGRLDRIGQGSSFEIWVPWIAGGPEEVLFRWYHEGLGVFERVWNGGAALVENIDSQLTEAIESAFPKSKLNSEHEDVFKRLLAHTRVELERLQTEYQDSVDVLVDFNSFDRKKGEALCEKIRTRDESPALKKYMEDVFDFFGIIHENLDDQGAIRLNAHSLSFIDNFPELPTDRDKAVTYKRSLALTREDLTFLTQDHPMVQGALSLLLDRDQGRAAVAKMRRVNPWKKEGAVLQLSYLIETRAPASLEIERYLPLALIEVMVDTTGKVLPPEYTVDPANLSAVPDNWIQAQLNSLQQFLPPLIEKASAMVERQCRAKIEQAVKTATLSLREEGQRLQEFGRRHASVADREIAAHERRIVETMDAISSTSPRLDAIRLLLIE